MKNKLLNKTSSLLIAGIMILSITACSGGSAKENNTSGTTESTLGETIPTIETQTLAPDDDTAETETLNESTESSSDTTESTDESTTK